MRIDIMNQYKYPSRPKDYRLSTTCLVIILSILLSITVISSYTQYVELENQCMKDNMDNTDKEEK